jgi:hypothetical protein
MPQSDIEYGDVFLFEHDSSCISRLISALDDSPISHAAMYCRYLNPDGSAAEGIVEEGTSGIGTRPVDAKLSADRVVHVRRYSGASSQLQNKLCAVAQKHLDAKEPYSMSNLVMLGVLLAFKKWKPDASTALKDVLYAICFLMEKIIEKARPGEHGATCSQLVYEMYKEAGDQLEISLPRRSAANGEGIISLALAKSALGAQPMQRQVPAYANGLDLEKLCCVLLDLLGDHKKDNADFMRLANLDEGVYGALAYFSRLVLIVDSKNVPEEAFGGPVDWALRALQHLFNNYANFVTPGQLYNYCPALKLEVCTLGPGS